MKICNTKALQHYEKECGSCCLPEKKGVAKVRALQVDGSKGREPRVCDLRVRNSKTVGQVRGSFSKGTAGGQARDIGIRHQKAQNISKCLLEEPWQTFGSF